MTEMQSDFEDWLSVNSPCVSDYEKQHIEGLMWQAWQASRAAIVVELPPQHEVVYDGYDGAELRYALKQIGVNYE